MGSEDDVTPSYGYGYGYAPTGSSPPPPPPPRRSTLEWFRVSFRESPVTVAIVTLTIAVWLIHLALQQWGGINTDLTLQDPGTAIRGDWWRLVTPMVVHYGLAHIGLNMLTLWIIGKPVEKVVGRWNFLASYVACGMSGQVISDLHYGVGAGSGGASGAIFGVLGMLIGNYVVTNWAEGHGRPSRQQWRFNSGVVKSLGIQAGLWLLLGSALAHVDTAAHAGGVALGLILGGVIAYSRTAPASGP